ncbi:hypothetical protein MKW98_011294 [Papaver atlanticum]|uniref:Uncharacterized protein n=1 Tax=Papaver atlanticum TaxID=357466 RepID=A0AAD4XKS0_9MAGN|nr:hypothetical protein MKW98_011294 [Papaver atlanticum]
MAKPRINSSSSSTSKQSIRRSYKNSGFRKRLLWVLKQQKTRFYILRRCITMLLCWHEHAFPDD